MFAIPRDLHTHKAIGPCPTITLLCFKVTKEGTLLSSSGLNIPVSSEVSFGCIVVTEEETQRRPPSKQELNMSLGKGEYYYCKLLHENENYVGCC